jgi:CRISPR-associated protein Cas1
MDEGVAIMVCDSKHVPAGIMLPAVGHALQASVIRAQADARPSVTRRIWQAVIRAKVEHQGAVLSAITGDDAGLGAMAQRVRSGDPANLEARAARKYWPLLMGSEFRRDRDAGGTNALLNYGYSLIRAAMARALVGAGLSPSLGIHHHNQYDAFCLADDAFEPLRPMVDFEVFRIVRASRTPELSRESKEALLLILTRNLPIGATSLPLFEALARYAASLRTALKEGVAALEIPGLNLQPSPADDASHG